MACTHNQRSIDELDDKIDDLEIEKEKYDDVITSINETQTKVSCVTEVLENLSSQCSRVIAGGSGFAGQAGLEQGIKNFEDIDKDFNDRIKEIEKHKAELDAQIKQYESKKNQYQGDCAICQAANNDSGVFQRGKASSVGGHKVALR